MTGSSTRALPVSKVVQAAGPSIWPDLYDRERKHLVAVATAAIRADVEERRVRLAESQGELVAQAIRAILTDLGLSPEQETLVAEVCSTASAAARSVLICSLAAFR